MHPGCEGIRQYDLRGRPLLCRGASGSVPVSLTRGLPWMLYIVVHACVAARLMSSERTGLQPGTACTSIFLVHPYEVWSTETSIEMYLVPVW